MNEDAKQRAIITKIKAIEKLLNKDGFKS